MKIRIAKESDYENLMNLYNKFVGNDRYSKLDNDSFKKVITNKNNFIFVAEDNSKLIGFATFSVRLVVRYPKPIAELDELFVDENYRRAGVGKMLMNMILDKAKELGCYRLFIESHYDHKGAHKFYESLGFTNYGYHFIKNL
jgi:GNAT superfamily N-acetyltransferase